MRAQVERDALVGSGNPEALVAAIEPAPFGESDVVVLARLVDADWSRE
jgi:hypothetical protein